jgi:hypothetical protein
VFTFAAQVKHVAAGNYFLFSPVAGGEVPAKTFNDGKGPDNLKTKADIIKFLKDSFALGHRAAATLTIENILQSPAGSNRHACIWPNSASLRRITTTARWSSICA